MVIGLCVFYHASCHVWHRVGFSLQIDFTISLLCGLSNLPLLWALVLINLGGVVPAQHLLVQYNN